MPIGFRNLFVGIDAVIDNKEIVRLTWVTEGENGDEHHYTKLDRIEFMPDVFYDEEWEAYWIEPAIEKMDDGAVVPFLLIHMQRVEPNNDRFLDAT